MDWNWMPRLKDFLVAFFIPWHVAAPIAVGSALILFLRWLGIPDLEALPAWLFGVVWIVLIYAGVVLLIRAIQTAEGWVRQANERRKRRAWINNQLDRLSPEERQVFAYLLEHNQNSVPGRLADGRYFGPLVQKGLLIRAPGQNNFMEWPHTVPDDVWKELVRRRDEFVDGEQSQQLRR